MNPCCAACPMVSFVAGTGSAASAAALTEFSVLGALRFFVAMVGQPSSICLARPVRPATAPNRGQLHPVQVPRVRGRAKVTRQVAPSQDLDLAAEISAQVPFLDRPKIKREAALVADSRRQNLAKYQASGTVTAALEETVWRSSARDFASAQPQT